MWLKCPLHALRGGMSVAVDGSGSLDEASLVRSLHAVVEGDCVCQVR